MSADEQQGVDVVPALPSAPVGAVRLWTAGLTTVVAALVCLGAFAGDVMALAAVVVLALLLAGGWSRLLDLPSPRGTTAVLALSGAASAVAVARADAEPRLEWLALALAGGVVTEFVHQLLRRDGRPRLVESVSGTVAGVVVLGSAASVLALPDSPSTATGVVTWAAPVVAGSLVQLAPLPRRFTLPLGVLVGLLVGGLLGGLFDDGTVVAGLLCGGVATAVALMVHRLLEPLPAAGRAPGWLALAVAPLATSAMAGYVALRLTLG
ncbi:hypothetical protein GCM10027446_12290 [Angustibacter peucedani]